MTLDEAITQIEPPDHHIAAQVQVRLDRLTKPRGSLGRLEEVAVRYATIIGEVLPKVPRGAVFTFAADHGVAIEGVSAYPREVTQQMVLNFLRGGAGVNVLARHTGVEVRVVDIGVAAEFGTIPQLIQQKVMPGTRNFLVEQAMSREQARRALEVGTMLALDAARDGIGLIGTGEMGIGNTTASAAITTLLTGRPVAEVTGRGQGSMTRPISTRCPSFDGPSIGTVRTRPMPSMYWPRSGDWKSPGWPGSCSVRRHGGYRWSWMDSSPEPPP